MDAYTKYAWLFLMHHKSQVLTAITRFKTFDENLTSYKLKAIQTDNTKEFLWFKQFTQEFGISHRLICLHTHEHNESIEWKHMHI